MRTLIALLALSSLAFAAEVPRKAPEFSIQMPDGGQKLLSSYKGKVVLVEFLFTTCPHCQHSSQVLSQLQSEFGHKGFQALGVSFNPMSKMLVADFVRDYKVNFPVGFSERDPVTHFLQNPPDASLHVPQFVFIDRKGMIRRQSAPRNDNVTGNPDEIRKTIMQLLAEPASAGGAPAKKAPAGAKKAS